MTTNAVRMRMLRRRPKAPPPTWWQRHSRRVAWACGLVVVLGTAWCSVTT